MFCVCVCVIPVHRLFCPLSTDDETKDLELQRKIRSFQWITPQHLDATIVDEKEQVRKLIEEAQQGE